jgi:hypothetical protein
MRTSRTPLWLAIYALQRFARDVRGIVVHLARRRGWRRKSHDLPTIAGSSVDMSYLDRCGRDSYTLLFRSQHKE